MGWCLPLNGLLSATQIMMYICRALVVLLTIPFHESAHALVSHWLGDDTAVRAGRLSLNPMRHFDPLGALCMLVGGVGWAKPVSIRKSAWQSLPRPVLSVTCCWPGCL